MKNQLLEKERLSGQAAINVATKVQTIPPAFAYVMQQIKPRMAVAYHFLNDYNTRYGAYDEIRQLCIHRLTMATDFLIWNINKREITSR